MWFTFTCCCLQSPYVDGKIMHAQRHRLLAARQSNRIHITVEVCRFLSGTRPGLVDLIRALAGEKYVFIGASGIASEIPCRSDCCNLSTINLVNHWMGGRIATSACWGSSQEGQVWTKTFSEISAVYLLGQRWSFASHPSFRSGAYFVTSYKKSIYSTNTTIPMLGRSLPLSGVELCYSLYEWVACSFRTKIKNVLKTIGRPSAWKIISQVWAES